MSNHHLERIRQKYKDSGSDHTELFETILAVAEETGMDAALRCLEQCAAEKRLEWLDEQEESIPRTGNPVLDAYHAFYEMYLGVSIPHGGEAIELTRTKLVMRWWNECPTLEACRKFGLDTRDVCRKVYHQPVQEFLERIDPRLKFDRNYDALRPHTEYCEEIITLEEDA
jgi:hypothetical protein